MSKMKKTRKPGGGRKKLKPEYDAGKNLKEQMDAAVALYNSEMSLQAIADALNLNPIKVRKLLITAGVYESEVAEKVKNTFEEYRETQDYKTSMHDKFCIVDLDYIMHGSYNWTKAANYNGETLVTTVDRNLVKKFADEFLKIYNENK